MIKEIVVLMLTVVFSFGAGNSAPYTNEEVTSSDELFQLEMVQSFDGRLRVEINGESPMSRDESPMIRVDVYDEESSEQLYSFEPVRCWDFWGVCFENDNYNIWIQSGDIGLVCYEYDGEIWRYNPNAVIPTYILEHSRYQKYIE